MRLRHVLPQHSPKRLRRSPLVDAPMTPGEIWAVVVAGGQGRRFGTAKQFLELDGIEVLTRSIRAARSVASGVVAVLPDSAVVDRDRHGGADVVVPGGSDRAASVRAGLEAVPVSAAVIIVHDAARPLASAELFQRVIAGLRDGVDGAIPGLSLTDTVKRVDGSQVVETLERDTLVAVQTPQAFRASALRAAHASGKSATDDAALVELAGGVIEVVPGEARNLKLTTPADLELALRYLREIEQGAPA